MKLNKSHTIPLVDLKKQYRQISRDINRSIKKVIERTDFIMGREVAEFETKFAQYLGVKHTVGVASGTAALHLALKVLGVGEGDEVILPALTFTATAEPVVWLGAKPVFVDIDEKTFTLDPRQIINAITSKTKAIIPVHLYGQPAQMDEILKIARRHKLSVLEDAAQAHGARFGKYPVGTIGDLGIFSFYPGKNLGAYGDAGLVVTANKKYARHIRLLRDHGREKKYEHDLVGFADRLDTLQAAVLLAKLPFLPDWNKKRAAAAAIYGKNLKAVKQVRTPYCRPDSIHAFHLYVIRCESRDSLKKYLSLKGIQTGIHYPIPLHLQKAYRFLGYKKGDLGKSEKIAASVLSLPMFPEITEKQMNFICRCIKSFYS